MSNTDLFTGKAEVYAKARPTYSTDAVRYIQELIPQDAVIAEIGAGTGKLTLPLARLGYRIFAIEPNEDMRAQLLIAISSLPNVAVLDATAEKTTLPAQCVDAIICAQALHWFDPDAFRAECLRIGKADAVAIAVYNNAPGADDTSHSKTSTDAFFHSPMLKEFPNTVYYSREDWLAYMTSHSHDPLPDTEEYHTHIEKMNQFFDAESEDGVLAKHLSTCVYSENVLEL